MPSLAVLAAVEDVDEAEVAAVAAVAEFVMAELSACRMGSVVDVLEVVESPSKVDSRLWLGLALSLAAVVSPKRDETLVSSTLSIAV